MSAWIPVEKQMPHDGQLVIVRVAESISKNVLYGVGWYDGTTMGNTGLVLTARPKTDAGFEVIAWCPLPE
jgi:hypothetical protein